MNGHEFFDLAIRLSDGKMASELRSCVSRAYYGAFHVVREFVHQDCRVNIPADAASHTKLHQLLESTKVPLLESVGRKLSMLREARNNADYKLDHNASNSKLNAMVQLRTARDIINDVEIGLDATSRDAAIQELRTKAESIFRLIVRS